MARIKSITGGVCTAKGFRAAGVAAEIKYKGRNDVALIVADAPCAAAAVFTTNKVAAAPVVLDDITLQNITGTIENGNPVVFSNVRNLKMDNIQLTGVTSEPGVFCRKESPSWETKF